LTAADYPLSRLRPLFDDQRPDLRRLAVAIAREELRTWNDRPSSIGWPTANTANRAPSPSSNCCGWAKRRLNRPCRWIGCCRNGCFSWPKAATRSLRETALTLIRRHHERLGDPARLAWLMESPHREVGLFTVRLLWERQRRKFAPTAKPPPSLNPALRSRMNCANFCARLCLACHPVGWSGASWTPNRPRPIGRGPPASANAD
jgi:hypothetical protein